MVKIFVGRLSPNVTSSQLRELFEKYGTVSDCDILRDYGFVHMSDENDAHRAIAALDKYDLCGSKLSVELSTSRSMKSCQLIVKNLPNAITSQDLHKLFKKFGTVTLCRIMGDHAVVHMRFPSMANNAVRNLSGETFRGNVLSVEFANNNNNKATNVWIKGTTKSAGGFPSESSNGLTDTLVSRQNSVKSVPAQPPPPPPRPTQAWNDVASGLKDTNHNHVTEVQASVSTVASASSPANPTPVQMPKAPVSVPATDLREGRRYRIGQGLQFLQSSMPWSGTPERYEAFLNQLKEMLLEEGAELSKEGHPKEAAIQLSEGINICAYMQKEKINGHLNFLEKLLMERAGLFAQSRNLVSALEDIEKVINLSNGANQHALRLKARILADCGRRNDALVLMLKFSQVGTFDAESAQLFNILKQSIGSDEQQVVGGPGTKGAVGDGRNSSGFGSNSVRKLIGQSGGGVASGSLPWATMNGDGDSKSVGSFGNFSKPKNITAAAPAHESQPGSKFQSFFTQNQNTAHGGNSAGYNGVELVSNMLSKSQHQPHFGPISRPSFPNNSNFQNSSHSLFSTDSLFSSNATDHLNTFNRDNSMPLPIGYRRSHSLGGGFPIGREQLWKENPATLGMPAMTSVDSKVDEELARAIEDELKTGSTNNTHYMNKQSLWHMQSDPSGNSLYNGVAMHSTVTPSYTHFPIDSPKSGFTGSVLGPAMLGINTGAEQHAKEPSSGLPNLGSDGLSPATLSASYTSQNSIEQFEMSDSLSEILRNPLHDTHEFKLGCSECVSRTGPRVVDFKHSETIVHTCAKNILLCRHRTNVEWMKVRPRPQPQSKAQLYDGPYYICKDLMAGQDCTYPAVCTFAYNQEEIDVWTLEKKGMLDRSWLFKSMDMSYVKNFSLVGLIICKHRGTFDFLCKACFQHKPRIISKFSATLGHCTNESSPHQNSAANQQLTHIIREASVRYTEIRAPFQQAILCRHAIRFQCSRGTDCHFAHSLVERDIWAIMDKESLSPMDVVKQAVEHLAKQAALNGDIETCPLFAGDTSLAAFRWKAKFICSLCHKNGQVSEATKDMKYCTARAQHSWSMNKKVMLVLTCKRSWAQVRDLPYLKNKNLPVRFELCENFRRSKKCSFSAKCNFAHSQEEMDIWMYLRDNNLKDLEELYDILTKAQQAKLSSKNSVPGSDASSILLPTDITALSAYHCWLCDKECNGQRQWEQHCASAKHKARAISDSDGHWKYRNPGGNYKLCERHEKGVCEYDLLPASENSCSFAHSRDELEEWIHRRQYVIDRIRKAQDDHLIDAEDNVDYLIQQSAQS